MRLAVLAALQLAACGSATAKNPGGGSAGEGT